MYDAPADEATIAKFHMGISENKGTNNRPIDKINKDVSSAFKMISLPAEGIVLRSVNKSKMGGTRIVPQQPRIVSVAKQEPVRPVEVPYVPPPVEVPYVPVTPTVVAPVQTNSRIHAAQIPYAACVRCGGTLGENFMVEEDENGLKKFHPHCYLHRCEKCNKMITTSCVNVLDQRFHEDCFCCTSCNRKLSDSYVDRKGQPFCVECGTPPEVLRRVCAACNVLIDPFANTTVLCDELAWHKDCFACSQCKKPIVDEFSGRFSCVQNADGSISCNFCHSGESSTGSLACAGCRGSITGNFKTTKKNEKYHPECFTCDSCGQQLKTTHYERDDKRFCQNCSVCCASCNKPCVGKYAIAFDKSWHYECFRCTKCKILLTNDFNDINDQPYCDRCN